jgi:hypothetical protein
MAERTRRGGIDLASALTGVLGAQQEAGQPVPASQEPPLLAAPALAVVVPEPQAAAPPQGPPPPGSFPVGAVPAPHSPTGHGQLTQAEEAHLAVCEAALDNLRVAFWAAGKALQTVRDARLYRGSHDTFEDYIEQRWDMSVRQAYRLIAAWPVAERVSPVGPALTESQVRELLPVADSHGPDAAAVVYQAVAETDGVRVTASVLHDVVAILPRDYFDPAEAVRQIRDYLNGDQAAPLPPAADPVKLFSRADRTISRLEQVAAEDVLEAARAADPELVSRMAARMRAVADQFERGPST